MVYDERETARLPGGIAARQEPAASAEPAEVAARGETAAAVRRGRSTFIRELIETILLTLVIFIAVRTLIVNYRVDGDSMQPSLHDGQYLLVNKAVYFHLDRTRLRNLLPGPDRSGRDVVYPFHPPRRGEIVIFDPPVSAHSDQPFVKRVIGLPGETIAIREGRVYVDGQPLDEPYVAELARGGYFAYGGGADFTVPPGSIYVLGDNRNNSKDSRSFQEVPLDRVIGKAIISYWPPGDIGPLPHERYANAGEGH